MASGTTAYHHEWTTDSLLWRGALVLIVSSPLPSLSFGSKYDSRTGFRIGPWIVMIQSDTKPTANIRQPCRIDAPLRASKLDGADERHLRHMQPKRCATLLEDTTVLVSPAGGGMDRPPPRQEGRTERRKQGALLSYRDILTHTDCWNRSDGLGHGSPARHALQLRHRQGIQNGQLK